MHRFIKTVLLLLILTGNIFSAILFYYGCWPFSLFVLGHVLRMNLGFDMGTFLFCLIVLYGILIICTIIASGILSLKRKYKSALLFSFLPLIIGLGILPFVYL